MDAPAVSAPGLSVVDFILCRNFGSAPPSVLQHFNRVVSCLAFRDRTAKLWSSDSGLVLEDLAI
jgi:hypothetical protein